MLKHLNTEERKPKRVVVLGHSGFIGEAIFKTLKLHNVPVKGISSKDLDMTSSDAGKRLTEKLEVDDVLVFISAQAPCKNSEMLINNIQIANNVCDALKKKPVSQVVYMSSDAVYRDSKVPISEASCAEPNSIHGVMHLAREVMIKQAYFGPLAIVRSTLVYGLNDPHNGYGPNRFRRMAKNGEDIILFGEGEECRDHIHVEDIANLVEKIIFFKSIGTINAVSGETVSFRELANFLALSFDRLVTVKSSPRSGPMPHNGYRAFDNSAIYKSFPGFVIKSWKEGLALVNDQFRAMDHK